MESISLLYLWMMSRGFIAREVATILEYSDTAQAIRTNVDEEDQKMLSYSECKKLFDNLLQIEVDSEDSETVGAEENLKPVCSTGLKNAITISNFGMKLINESGLHSLVFASKKTEAKVFKRWVTSEVLPSIRKTGSYSVQAQTPSYTIEDKIKRAQAWIEEQKHILQLEEERAALEAKNAELEEQLDEANVNIIRLEAERDPNYLKGFK